MPSLTLPTGSLAMKPNQPHQQEAERDNNSQQFNCWGCNSEKNITSTCFFKCIVKYVGEMC